VSHQAPPAGSRSTRRVPVALYPVGIPIAYVLSVYSESVIGVGGLVRPALVAVGIGVLIYVLMRIALKDWQRAAFFSALVMLALVRQWGVIVLLIAMIEVVIVSSYLRRNPIGPEELWSRVTAGANVVTALVLAISLASLALGGRLAPVPSLPMSRGSVADGLPDIYLVLLDGYPRSDTQARDFGLDNTPFEESLEELGFEVAAKARSNYNMTVLTLASMLDMRQVPFISRLTSAPSDEHGQYLAAQALLDSASGLMAVRDLGYEIVSVPSEFNHLAVQSGHRYLDGGTMSAFELDLITSTLGRDVFPDQIRGFAADQHRKRIDSSLTLTGDIASERTDRPKFVLTHVLAPHTPIVLSLTGSAANGPTCFPARCTFWSSQGEATTEALQGQAEQIRAVNVQVLETVRRILSQSARPPVIILFSDHGHRLNPADQEEMFRNFFASYTPRHPGLFPEDASPVNVLPRLLNAYARLSVPLATEESYAIALDQIAEQGFLNLKAVATHP
jgi:hypothetical protein